MAHGDALIFLTNITWVFFLFILLYLFFVVYFLPTFYKKFRIRSLVQSKLVWVGAISVQNVFSGLIFLVDLLKEFGARVIISFISKSARFADIGFSIISIVEVLKLPNNLVFVTKSLTFFKAPAKKELN